MNSLSRLSHKPWESGSRVAACGCPVRMFVCHETNCKVDTGLINLQELTVVVHDEENGG